jgi:DnaJ-class molecular chaperone
MGSIVGIDLGTTNSVVAAVQAGNAVVISTARRPPQPGQDTPWRIHRHAAAPGRSGRAGTSGGLAGDLYLSIRVAPHATFERDGDDLFTKVPVDIYTAALGGEVRVPSLDGAVMLKIPPQTQLGRTLRLRGKGMPRPNDLKRRGDLYARVRLMLPEPLSERELEAFELAATRRGSPAHGSAGPLCGMVKRGWAGRTRRTSRAPQDVSDRRRMR